MLQLAAWHSPIGRFRAAAAAVASAGSPPQLQWLPPSTPATLWLAAKHAAAQSSIVTRSCNSAQASMSIRCVITELMLS